MSQTPSTPVKVPSSAANYSEATLDPDLRSQINTILLRDGHVSKIQDRLLHALNAHASNWPTTVQSHALALLRSGEVITYPALLRRVLEDIHEATSSASSKPTKNGSKTPNGDAKTTAVNGTLTSATSISSSSASSDQLSLAVPQLVVDEALRVTRECLENVCEIEEGPGSIS